MQVLSFDPLKVRIDRGVVYKTTTKAEYIQTLMASDFLGKCPMVLDCGIKVEVVPVLGWTGDSL